MSLVTRVSVAFLVVLGLALGGFSASLHYLARLRLRLALDQELEATLDRFPDRPEGQSGRVTWAIYDEAGQRVESAVGDGRPMVRDGSTRMPSGSGGSSRRCCSSPGPTPRPSCPTRNAST